MDPMFKRLDPRSPADAVSVLIDGTPVQGARGETVAAAVLASGLDWTRTTPVSGARRGPLCMMGICFECLMVIDGRPNRQACQVVVEEGMTIERQLGTGPAP